MPYTRSTRAPQSLPPTPNLPGVPPLKKHAKKADFSELGCEAFEPDTRDCITPWIDTLRLHVGSTTQPAIIREIMDYLRLSNT